VPPWADRPMRRGAGMYRHYPGPALQLAIAPAAGQRPATNSSKEALPRLSAAARSPWLITDLAWVAA